MPDAGSAFAMHGAREAMASGMVHIEQQVTSIESAVAENPGLTFDLSKTIVESVCRTILTERSVPWSPADDLPVLFKSTTNNLVFLPPAVSGEAGIGKSLRQTLNGLHTALQGICELRNRCGFASHGGDASKPQLEGVQALLAAASADAIVGFLARVHRQGGVSGRRLPMTFDPASEFNGYVDELHDPIKLFDGEYRPSEVLFAVDPQAYRIYLTEYEPEAETGATASAVKAMP